MDYNNERPKPTTRPPSPPPKEIKLISEDVHLVPVLIDLIEGAFREGFKLNPDFISEDVSWKKSSAYIATRSLRK